MCGIIGHIHADPAFARHTVQAGLNALAHRGPDSDGASLVEFGRDWLALGHRRLSILDLSAAGHQPMPHSATGCQIVFNGEIYNFRRLRRDLEGRGEVFHSGSDTEVLLAGLVLEGESFLDKLEGMFAFAFFDARTKSLLLARDPAGIKPLYFADRGASFAFASEVRAILETGVVPPRIDRQGMAGFLAYGAVQHPSTLFEGIRSLRPGSWATIKAESQTGPQIGRTESFWSLPECDLAFDEDSATSAVRNTLGSAVEDHLVADVPVGVFLSSGIDSTIIGGLAAKQSGEIRSFTIVFEDQPDFSEKHIAADTARQFGLQHTEIPLTTDAAEASFAEWLNAVDQPSIDGWNVYLISKAVRQQGIKVALSGLGADELFGGYPSFRDVPRLRKLTRLTGPLPGGIRNRLAGVVTAGRSVAVRDKMRDTMSCGGTLFSICLRRRRVISDTSLARLGICAHELGLDQDFLPPHAVVDIDRSGRDEIRAISQVEFRCYQGNMLLRDADSNGMANSLEIRVPFLDKRLLNLAHSIPGSVRLPKGQPAKHLLRKAFPDLLRSAITQQPKKGFALPVGKWMTSSLRPACEESLTRLADSGLVRADGITSLWDTFLREPESPMWSRVFALVVLGEFVRKTNAVA